MTWTSGSGVPGRDEHLGIVHFGPHRGPQMLLVPSSSKHSKLPISVLGWPGAAGAVNQVSGLGPAG